MNICIRTGSLTFFQPEVNDVALVMSWVINCPQDISIRVYPLIVPVDFVNVVLISRGLLRLTPVLDSFRGVQIPIYIYIFLKVKCQI